MLPFQRRTSSGNTRIRGFCRHIITTLLILSLAAGCATIPQKQVGDQVEPLIPGHELSDDELLKVSIRVFNPGELPADPEKRRGLAPEIREAEARFAPIHLKHTLQRTGYWGAVRVVPDDDIGAELLVRGEIIFSDGESAVLEIEAVDASNRVWYRRTYAETARPEEHYGIEPEIEDTFQDLFNSIANDLIIFKNNLSPAEIAEIRHIALLRYARSMAPDAFNGYLATAPDGHISLMRLPADQDPMLDRVNMVKARDDMLVDTINDHYDIYYQELWEPYSSWRRFRQEEVVAMRELEREALAKQLLGIAAIAGAIALGVTTNYETSVRTQPLQQVLIAGGTYSIYSGYQTGQESQINKDAIEELGLSFSSEAEPLVLDVEGKTIRLTGSAEQQYSTWRSMLRQLYARETGLIPMDDQAEPSPPAAGKTQP